LTELRRESEFAVERVEADSDRGRSLVSQHRPAMFPLILVDGVFFSVGRLPRGKLRALLSLRAMTGARP
jgi:hypothetical protein